MTIAFGVALVLLAIVFVLLPLFHKSKAKPMDEPDPAVLRAGIYRQILDAELDTRLGKLELDEFQDLRTRLLRDAATLIVAAEGSTAVEVEAAARVEDEIAAARAAMRRNPSMGGISA